MPALVPALMATGRPVAVFFAHAKKIGYISI